MMNCVLEKRRQPTFLPFEAQRSLKVFCRGGRDEPFGPVVAIASSFDKDEGEMPMRMRPMMSPAAMLARTFFQPPRRLPMSPKRPMGGVRVLPPFLIPMKLDEKEGPGPNLDSLESAVMKALGPLEFILNEEVLGPRPEFNTSFDKDEGEMPMRMRPMMSPAAMLARTFFQPPRRLPMSPKRPMGGVRLDEKEGPGPNLDSLESAVMKALGPLEFILNEKPSDEEDAKHRQNSDEVPLPFEVESPVGPHEKNKPFPA
ncbi:unnamed protein product, partial [Notodromas monacha]